MWIWKASPAPFDTSSCRSGIIDQPAAGDRADEELEHLPVRPARAAGRSLRRVLAHCIAPSSPLERRANSISVTSVSRRLAERRRLEQRLLLLRVERDRGSTAS